MRSSDRKPVSVPSRRIGRFDVIRPIGSGGMGPVFEARARDTGAPIALKVLKHPASLAQFKHEFRVLSELSHPNVVRFVELFEDGGTFCLAMELVNGVDFLSYVRPGLDGDDEAFGTASTVRPTAVSGFDLRRQAPPSDIDADRVLDPLRLRHALQELVSGLMALHAAGLVHRDLKPQNVLVTEEGRVVILDFGLAVSNDEPHRAELAGTLAYMAPEQLLGLPLTPATDWYALGVVLYQALTGRLPPAHFPPVPAHKAAVLVSPSALAPGVPPDLNELCLLLLSPDPAARPVEAQIAAALGLQAEIERGRSSFRSHLHFARNVFVGREEELAALDAALEDSRSHGLQLVSVVGDSGVGKSALIRRFISRLRQDHPEALIFSGRCYDREVVPYRGVDRVIDMLADHLGKNRMQGALRRPIAHAPLLEEVFPALNGLLPTPAVPQATSARLDPNEARRLAFQALADVLRELSATRPTLVHIDDAHWLDDDSIALLSTMTSGAAAPFLCLVVTRRPAAPARLAELERNVPSCRSMVVGTLGAEDSHALAVALLDRRGEATTERASTIAEKSAGHPLFIHELVLHGGNVTSQDSLTDALRARVARLVPAGRRLLELVALAASPIPHDVVRAAAELSPADYPWALTALRSENLVSFQGFDARDGVQTYHDRIREMIVADMPRAAYLASHRTLALSIETHAPTDSEDLAFHFAEAGIRGKATHYAREAGNRALAKMAFDQAARWYRSALASADTSDKTDLEVQLGHALGSAGRGVEAADAYLRAAALSGRDASIELRRRAGEQLLRGGHITRGLDILREILRDLGMRLPRNEVEQVWDIALSLTRLQLGRLIRPRRRAARAPGGSLRMDTCWTLGKSISTVHHLLAMDFQLRALVLALELEDEDAEFRSMTLLGTTLGMSSGLAKRVGQDLVSRAREIHDRAPSREREGWLALNAGVAAMGNWDFDACVRHCEIAEAIFRAEGSGAGWEDVTAQAFVLWALSFQGQFKAAAARLPALLTSAHARGDRHAIATLTLSPVHLLGLAANEPDRVRRECETVRDEWPDEFACFQHMCAEYILAQVDLFEGASESAWRHQQVAWTMLRRSHLSRVQFQRIDLLGLRARAALAQAVASPGQARRWLERVDADAQQLSKEPIRAAAGLSVLVSGGASFARGRTLDAIRAFDEAYTHFRAQRMSLHAGIARLARGIAARSENDSRLATEELNALGVLSPLRMLDLWVPGVAVRARSTPLRYSAGTAGS